MANKKVWIVCATLVAASAAGWTVGFDDRSMPPHAVLGGYANGWAVLNLGLSYAAAWSLVFALRPPGRKALMALTAAHLSVAAVVGAAEVLSLAGGVDFARLIPNPMRWEREGADQWKLPNQVIEGEAPTDLSFVFGLDVPPVPFSFRTDSHGLRNPVEKPDPRVVCLGDSVLVAGLVPVEQTVTERLQSHLGVEVLNVSWIGYSPEQALARFESTGIDPSGRVFLHFLFEGNDLSDSERFRAENRVTGDVPWRSAGYSNTPPWPYRGLSLSLLRMLHAHKRTLPRRRRGVFDANREVFFFYDGPTIDDALDQLDPLVTVIEAARDHHGSAGASYAVVFVPCKLSVLHAECAFPADSAISAPEMGRTRFGAELAAACEKAGVPFLDTTQGLRELAGRGELPYFPADTHLAPAGHGELARQVSPFARRLLDELER